MDLFSQSNQFRRVLALTFSMLCSDAIAGYNDIVWRKQSGLNPEISFTSFSNDTYVSDLTVTPSSGRVSMIAIDAECYNFTGATTTMTTQWMMFPPKGEYKGLKWSLKMNPAGVGGPFKGSEYGGSADDMLLPFSRVTFPSSDQACLHAGQQYSLILRSTGEATGSLTLDPALATPGIYNFNIPVAWVVEENKAKGGYGPILNRMGAILGMEPNMQIPVNFTLTPKCVFNTNDITLKHGNISIRPEVTEYYSNVYPLDIACGNHNVSLNVQLIGSALVPGKTINYTSCGKGSSCRLTFDVNGKVERYNETLNINKTTMTVNVKSTYMPSKNPVVGKFEGSAILRITIL